MESLQLERVGSAIEKALNVLGLNRETSKLLTLFPLLYVAWADGQLADEEMRKILEAAEDAGLSQGASGAVLLRWLGSEPPAEFWTNGLYLVTVLLGPDKSFDRHALLQLCEEVGRAAGGLFGLVFTFSQAERDAVERIAAALSLADPTEKNQPKSQRSLLGNLLPSRRSSS